MNNERIIVKFEWKTAVSCESCVVRVEGGRGKRPFANLTNPLLPQAAWQDTSRSRAGAKTLPEQGGAEQSGVNYGIALAEQFADGEDLRESLQIETFVGFGNVYRTLVSSGFVFEKAPVMTPLFDPRTPTSQFFVREFSQNAIIPTSNLFYFNLLRSQNPFYGFEY